MAQAAEEQKVPVPPWRGVGAEFDEPIEPDKARKKGDIGFPVAGKTLYWDDDGTAVKVPRAKAVVRLDTKALMSMMSESYPVMQYEDAFAPLDALTRTKRARYIAAGPFNEGKAAFMLAELPGTIKVGGHDPVSKHVLSMASLDGSVGTHLTIMPFRISTATTLPGGLRRGDLDINIHHRSNVESRLKESERLLGTVVKQFDTFRDLADDLFATKFSDGQMKRVAEHVFPGEVGNKLRLDRERLVELFQGDATAAGTAWGALCAVCEFLDHERTTRVRGGERDAEGLKERENRLASAWFGKSYRTKLDAFDFVRKVAKV
jgi:phage/plasmid-like protein (TIGR03299 family)